MLIDLFNQGALVRGQLRSGLGGLILFLLNP